MLYLSREGGPWYEYAATDVFPLYGATSDDDFVVVSELLEGYPAAATTSWSSCTTPGTIPWWPTSAGERSELGLLPLEDQERDEPIEPPDVVVVEDAVVPRIR